MRIGHQDFFRHTLQTHHYRIERQPGVDLCRGFGFWPLGPLDNLQRRACVDLKGGQAAAQVVHVAWG